MVVKRISVKHVAFISFNRFCLMASSFFQTCFCDEWSLHAVTTLTRQVSTSFKRYFATFFFHLCFHALFAQPFQALFLHVFHIFSFDLFWSCCVSCMSFKRVAERLRDVSFQRLSFSSFLCFQTLYDVFLFFFFACFFADVSNVRAPCLANNIFKTFSNLCSQLFQAQFRDACQALFLHV